MSGENNKYILPLLVYLPLIFVFVIFISFFGRNILNMFKNTGNLQKIWFLLRYYILQLKIFIKTVIKRLWPNEGTSVKGKLWTHIRADTILIGLTGIFLLTMTYLYNQKILIDTRNTIINFFISIFNPILGLLAPNKWERVKQNVKYKQDQTHNIGVAKRNPLIIGGLALFLGFSIFLTLLINNYNQLVKNTRAENHVKQLLTTTSQYLYLSVFVAVILVIFTALLFFAAKTDFAPKLVSGIIIFISAVIFLSAFYFLFQKKINEVFKQNTYMRLFINILFLIPCLLKDFVDYIYFEVKKTPKSVYYILLVQIFILLNIFVLPIIGKSIYLKQTEDKDLANKISLEIASLENEKARYNLAIKLIKKYNPAKSKVKLIQVHYDSVSRKNYDPNIIPVTQLVTLISNGGVSSPNDYGNTTDSTLKLFCIEPPSSTDKKVVLNKKGVVEYSGDLNISTNQIRWNTIRTIDGFHKLNYQTVSQKNKCFWDREKYESKKDYNFIKKYFGGLTEQNTENNKIPPTDISGVATKIEQLIMTYPSNEKAKLLKEIQERKEIIIKKRESEVGTSGDVMTDTVNLISEKIDDLRIYLTQTTGIDIVDENVDHSLPENYWRRIIKNNLDTYKNKDKLKQLLKNAGYVNELECNKILNNSERIRCNKTYENIKTHIFLNTKQLILYNNEIEQINERIKQLNELKKDVGFFQDGLLLQDEPIYFRNKVHLGNHNKFLKARPEDKTYNYSVSCWFYLHSNPPNYRKSNSRYTSILSFNNEPKISYNVKENTLLVETNNTAIDYDPDMPEEEKNQLKEIYKQEDFKLQRWHNIVVNYVGGTVDVFLNGDLVGSINRIAPYKTFNHLIVGENNGVGGGICSVVFFPNYLSKSKIKLNYNYLKNKNPPRI